MKNQPELTQEIIDNFLKEWRERMAGTERASHFPISPMENSEPMESRNPMPFWLLEDMPWHRLGYGMRMPNPTIVINTMPLELGFCNSREALNDFADTLRYCLQPSQNLIQKIHKKRARWRIKNKKNGYSINKRR